MKISKKILALVLAAAICAVTVFSGVNTIDAQAATKKVTTSGKFKSAVPKKAPTVKKGTTVVTLKKAAGFVKFKAPSTKSYKFTFSKLSGPNGFTSSFTSFLGANENGKLTFVPVKTYGGKNTALFLSSKKVSTQLTNAKKKDYFLTSRTATVKLKKGQTVYIYTEATGGKKTTYTLKIK